MVVLKPLLEGEFFRTCPKCSHIGLGSPIRERSSFYPDKSKRGAKYRWNCRWCSRVAARKYEQEHKDHMLQLRREARRRQREQMTPEQREHYLAYGREYYQRKKHDPEFRAKRNALAREWKERNKERLQEDRRIDARLRRERKGLWSPPPPDESSIARRTAISMPVGPPSKWLNEIVANRTKEIIARDELPPKAAEQKAITEIVRDLGTSVRTLYSIRHAERPVDLGTLDRLLTRHGGITLDELYSNYGDGYTIRIATDFSCLRIELPQEHPDPDTINPLDQHFWCGENPL